MAKRKDYDHPDDDAPVYPPEDDPVAPFEDSHDRVQRKVEKAIDQQLDIMPGFDRFLKSVVETNQSIQRHLAALCRHFGIHNVDGPPTMGWAPGGSVPVPASAIPAQAPRAAKTCIHCGQGELFASPICPARKNSSAANHEYRN